MGIFNRLNTYFKKLKPRVVETRENAYSDLRKGGSRRSNQDKLPYTIDNILLNMHPMYVYDILYRLYVGSWEVRKIVDIYVDDALRGGWECLDRDGNPLPVQSRSWKFSRAVNLENKVSLMLQQARLFGGSLIRKVKDEDNGSVMLEVVDQSRVQPLYDAKWIDEIIIDGVKQTEPFVFVPGFAARMIDVQHSYISMGGLMTRNYPFGLSIVFPFLNVLLKSFGTQEGAYHLVNLASCLIAGVKNLRQRFAMNEDPTGGIDEILDSLNMYRGAVIDADAVTFQSHNSSFGSVPELVMSFLQILSAASDIPATRFLGQAPGGLNATGESDLENYYNAVEAYRKKTIVSTLLKIYEMCGFPEVADIKFEPLWNRPESEIAQTEATRVQYIMQMVESQIVTRETGFKLLQNHGIIPDDIQYDNSAAQEDRALMEKLLSGDDVDGSMTKKQGPVQFKVRSKDDDDDYDDRALRALNIIDAKGMSHDNGDGKYDGKAGGGAGKAASSKPKTAKPSAPQIGSKGAWGRVESAQEPQHDSAKNAGRPWHVISVMDATPSIKSRKNTAIRSLAHDVATVNKLSDVEKKAFRLYSERKDAESINNALRLGGDADKAILAAMDGAFARAAITKPITVYRGVGEDAKSFYHTLKLGDVIADPAFVSTSTSRVISLKSYKGGEPGGTIMEIRVPEGTKAISIKSISAAPWEQEILFNRGTRLRVIDIDDSGDNRKMIMEVVPDAVALNAIHTLEDQK